MASQHPDIEKVLFTQEDIDGIVSRLGEQITRDYAGKDLVKAFRYPWRSY